MVPERSKWWRLLTLVIMFLIIWIGVATHDLFYTAKKLCAQFIDKVIFRMFFTFWSKTKLNYVKNKFGLNKTSCGYQFLWTNLFHLFNINLWKILLSTHIRTHTHWQQKHKNLKKRGLFRRKPRKYFSKIERSQSSKHCKLRHLQRM